MQNQQREKINKKEHGLILVEIDNCRQNIEFYQDQIANMEEKLGELERLKKGYEYY